MRVAEIYKSKQGEGALTGTDSVFLRASGCNLRCWYCDTQYASWYPEGDDLSVEEILFQMSQYDCRHAVLTGGEPMLFAELIPVCQGLKRHGFHITVETAGTLLLPVACDLMSISPKMSNSSPDQPPSPKWRQRHERTRTAHDIVAQLIDRYPYQLKFVVDAPRDLDEVSAYLASLPQVDAQNVLLMPQGTEAEQLLKIASWLEPECRRLGLRYCPRKHIEWFGLSRGT
jgi:7-carboxy-7-deazaguanine synthase